MPVPLPHIAYGGDYSPEQWSESDWLADIALLKEAQVNIASIGIFAWSSVERRRGQMDFSQLLRAIDIFWENGIAVCLATGTAAHPAWLSRESPECLITTIDGRRARHGRRINFCPNSSAYRGAATEYVAALAEKFSGHPAVVAWHIGNEYGHGARGSHCYCDRCGEAFREWLQIHYTDIDAVNRAWNLAFWGHLVSGWEEIEPPSLLNDRNAAGPSAFPGKSLDYCRFQSASHLECFRMEREILRRANPSIPATTNLMGAYRDLDYFAWASHLDFISWDCYSPVRPDPANAAFHHDLMRSLKPGQPFWIMESAPGSESQQSLPKLRPPGMLRLESLQALGRGADAILFFQLRQSRGGCEKLHGAVVQQGRRSDTFTFLECAALGERLACDGATLRSGFPRARVAVHFDWSTWWAYGFCALHAKDLDYIGEQRRFHGALFDLNVVADFVSSASELEGYDVLLLPLCYSFPEAFARKVRAFASAGGCVVMGAFSGRSDEHDLLWDAPAPGPLAECFGIRCEEFESPDADVLVSGEDGGVLERFSTCASRILELVTPAGAEVLARFRGGHSEGRPAVTKNTIGCGSAIYLATSLERDALGDLFRRVLPGNLLGQPFPELRLERIPRPSKDGRQFEFLLNHSTEAISFESVLPPREGLRSNGHQPLFIPPYDAVVVEWEEA